jgi:alcohol dehydrogenase class IV
VLDALCQAIEARWSVRACNESNADAEFAIREILQYMDAYLQGGSDEALEHILMAANHAGRAINLTTTTAAHAMSYKLTTTYGLPHGHSVGISLLRVWRYMLDHGEKCTDKRGYDYLLSIFGKIAAAMGYESAEIAISAYADLLDKIEIGGPVATDKNSEAARLAGAVNVERLGNNPVALDTEALEELYGDILR